MLSLLHDSLAPCSCSFTQLHSQGGVPSPTVALCVTGNRTICPSRSHFCSLVIFCAFCIGLILALPADMLNLLAALALPRAAAIVAVVVVLGVAVRRRYFSPISDVPGPFLGSVSLLWQLHKIFTKHTERATIDAHKRWGTS